MSKKQKILTVVLTFLLALLLFLLFTRSGRLALNYWGFGLHKADETSYSTQKRVEDSCRSMIASYNSNRLIYEQYRCSDSQEQQSWAEQARILANKTASTYNEYILKNSFVWQGNIPEDLVSELPYLTDEAEENP